MLRASVSKVSLTCVQQSPLSASEFVASLPRGAYTTARVLKRTDRVFELKRQVDRLIFSSQPFLQEAKLEQHNPASLQLAILSTIQQTCSNSAVQLEHEDCKLTVLIAVQWPDINIHAHLESMKPRHLKPIHVVLSTNMDVYRNNAMVKDSKWVQDRTEVVDAEAEETLLLSPEQPNEILEGSQTNFFAVTNDGCVVTAERGILLGTVRAVVLDACAELNIPVQLTPPLVNDIPQYAGAFLASTSRLVMRIDSIGDTVLPEQCDVIDRIAAWVEKHVNERSISATELLRRM